MSVKRPSFGILYIDIPLLVSAITALVLSCSQIEIGEAVGSEFFFIMQIFIIGIAILFFIVIQFRAFWPLLMQRNISLFSRLVFLAVYMGASYVAFDCFILYHSKTVPMIESVWNWIRLFRMASDTESGNNEICVNGQHALWVWRSQEFGGCSSNIISYQSNNIKLCANNNIMINNVDGNKDNYSYKEYKLSRKFSSLWSCMIP